MEVGKKVDLAAARVGTRTAKTKKLTCQRPPMGTRTGLNRTPVRALPKNSLKERGDKVCQKSRIWSSRATGQSESTTFPKAIMVCEVSMAHLRSLNFTWCKCNSVRHGGPISALRADFKVCGGNVAHSPGELEKSQRLIVFELPGACDHSNLVDSKRPIGGGGSYV